MVRVSRHVMSHMHESRHIRHVPYAWVTSHTSCPIWMSHVTYTLPWTRRTKSPLSSYTFCNTGWRRPIRCLKWRVIFRKRATKTWALLQKVHLGGIPLVSLSTVRREEYPTGKRQWQIGICKRQCTCGVFLSSLSLTYSYLSEGRL